MRILSLPQKHCPTRAFAGCSLLLTQLFALASLCVGTLYAQVSEAVPKPTCLFGDYVFVVDDSWSMREHRMETWSKIEALSKRYAPAMTAGQFRVGILRYAYRADLLHPLSVNPSLFNELMPDPFWIKRSVTSQGVYEAARLLLETPKLTLARSLKRAGEMHIVVFSDGGDVSIRNLGEQLVRELREGTLADRHHIDPEPGRDPKTLRIHAVHMPPPHGVCKTCEMQAAWLRGFVDELGDYFVSYTTFVGYLDAMMACRVA